VPKPARPEPLTTFETPEELKEAIATITDPNADGFRVVIRGCALVDDRIARVVDTALGEGAPRELKRMRVPDQLALAQALNFLTPDVVDAIKTLREIRHRLAHGSDEELTKADLRKLRSV
jgi:hypothetical protein